MIKHIYFINRKKNCSWFSIGRVVLLESGQSYKTTNNTFEYLDYQTKNNIYTIQFDIKPFSAAVFGNVACEHIQDIFGWCPIRNSIVDTCTDCFKVPCNCSSYHTFSDMYFFLQQILYGS